MPCRPNCGGPRDVRRQRVDGMNKKESARSLSIAKKKAMLSLWLKNHDSSYRSNTIIITLQRKKKFALVKKELWIFLSSKICEYTCQPKSEFILDKRKKKKKWFPLLAAAFDGRDRHRSRIPRWTHMRVNALSSITALLHKILWIMFSLRKRRDARYSEPTSKSVMYV